jgi:hypothetical protein
MSLIVGIFILVAVFIAFSKKKKFSARPRKTGPVFGASTSASRMKPSPTAKVNNAAENHRYTKISRLSSPAERSFLGILSLAAGEDTQIFAKVRVADVITPIKGSSKSQWQIAFNKISSKHFDYVLCDKNDLSIMCVVELNDRSHHSKNRRDRDAFLTTACQSAGLPLIMIPAKRTYTVHEVSAALEGILRKPETSVLRGVA